MSRQAADIIQKFYLTLREKHRSPDSTPITTRQLESLIRLCEARARFKEALEDVTVIRLELRENVTEDDAKEVVEIMKESLFERFEVWNGHVLHSNKQRMNMEILTLGKHQE